MPRKARSADRGAAYATPSAVEVTDRQRWDAKWAAQRGAPLEPPDAFVERAVHGLGGDLALSAASGRALDLAAGRGRHALWLARLGYSVEAWDVSRVGLADLALAARTAGLAVRAREVDLVGDGVPADAEPADLLVLANFLHRPLIASLARCVKPGGHWIWTTATVDRRGDKPPLAYCLERGELARPFPGFETLATFEADGRAGLLARRAESAGGAGK